MSIQTFFGYIINFWVKFRGIIYKKSTRPNIFITFFATFLKSTLELNSTLYISQDFFLFAFNVFLRDRAALADLLYVTIISIPFEWR